MQRDLDLMKQILIEVEALDKPRLDLPINGYDKIVVNEHIYLCSQDGFLEATILRDSEGQAAQAIVSRLTSQCHEFLRLARNTNLWNKAKSTFKDKAVDITIQTLFLYMKQEAIHLLPK